MKFVTVRDFKTHATKLMRENESVMVFRNGVPAGVFVPWADIQVEEEVRGAALKALAVELGRGGVEKGMTEEEVLENFASLRKKRRASDAPVTTGGAHPSLKE